MRKKVNYHADFEENLSYHIYNRSINKENIFEEVKDCEMFLRKLKKLILPFFDIEAYCIMPNHFHFLARVKPLTEEILKKIKYMGTSASIKFQNKETTYKVFLIDQFKRLFQSFATIYNQERKRNGSVFQVKFKRILIKDEFKWQHMLGYIHHNPIHHKFRKQFDDWKFSSYLAHLSNSPTLVAREQVLVRFDDDLEKAKEEFMNFHQRFKIDKEMNDFYLE